MFTVFFHELKAAGLPVTVREYLTLMEGMDKNLAAQKIEDFYFLSRAILVKDERNLDKFDRVDPAKVCRGAQHPRGREDWPLSGILAQHAKDRPNRLGVTMCRLLKVENDILYVQGLDAIDGTPVLDIKPVMRGFLPRGDIREPRWAGELMAGYWK